MILKILEYNAVRRFCTRPYYDTVYCFYDNRNNLVLIAWSNLSEQQGRFAGFFVLSTTENKSSGWWNKQVLCIEKQARRAGQYKPTRSVKRNIFVTPSAVMNEKNGNPWYPKSLTENISIHLHYPAHAYNISKQGCRKALGTRYYDATQRRSKAKTKVNNTTDVQNKTKKKNLVGSDMSTRSLQFGHAHEWLAHFLTHPNGAVLLMFLSCCTHPWHRIGI